MKRFHVHVFKLSQCLFAGGLLLILMIALFTANIAVQQASAKLKTNVLPLIIVDVGHGGEDGGAQSDAGVLEKDLNLAVAKKVELLLQTVGFDTLMTRTYDTLHYDESCATMREKKVSDIRFRFELMQKNANAVFLSIHQNHYSELRYHGTQVFLFGEPSAKQISCAIIADVRCSNASAE